MKENESYNESYDLVKEIIQEVFESGNCSFSEDEGGIDIVAPDGTFERAMRELGYVSPDQKFITEMNDVELQALDEKQRSEKEFGPLGGSCGLN